MLKFTNQLSDEFRRASSLSSLKIRQHSSSSIRHTHTHSHHPQFSNPQTHHPPHHLHLTPQPKHPNHCHTSPRSYPAHPSTYKPIQAVSNLSYSAPKQKTHSTGNPYIRTTPKRMPTSSSSSFYNQNCYNTHSAKLSKNGRQGYRQFQGMQMEMHPQMTLTEFRNSQQRLREKYEGGGREQSTAAKKGEFGGSYQSTFRGGQMDTDKGDKENKIQKLEGFLSKADYGAKMRISSINSLQNIQKRIQATLGLHNQLKVKPTSNI